MSSSNREKRDDTNLSNPRDSQLRIRHIPIVYCIFLPPQMERPMLNRVVSSRRLLNRLAGFEVLDLPSDFCLCGRAR